MNLLNEFLEKLITQISDIAIDIDRHEGGHDRVAWIDLSLKDYCVTIEYRPEVGFGLYFDEDDSDDLGSGPAEVYRDTTLLLNRLKKYFLGESNAEITKLKEIREILGISQKDLSVIFNQEQSSISKMESRENIFLNTLVSYIQNLGGTLEMKIHFKGCVLPLSVEKFFKSGREENFQTGKDLDAPPQKDG